MSADATASSTIDRDFAVGIARAFAGALIFALPMLMTMEMWQIGFSISPWRLILLLVVQMPLLVGLSRFVGFERTRTLGEDVTDAFVAIAVAVLMAAVVLFVFKVIDTDMTRQEVIGKIALQSFPGSIGALLARGQLGQQGRAADEDRQDPTYPGELFLMGVGALFLGLNVAPTEEMIQLSYMMDPWRELALVLLSLVIMHAFVYSIDFPGGSEFPKDMGFWTLFVRFTVVGYVVVLLICLYLLWTFGRTDGTDIEDVLSAAIVLGFPSSVGAAAARLIL
ncbi:TIGR02587 family membrane protein [Azospirillum rugosum]|uniref:Integral membrane protein (TIGR02587 family) n=1 Tax=Azospirillum rugosum TaxID=416170 RepID=A0ABS4SR00_9PROT|nr:TIGR02587 family membrane protein [Azospirillum rugosum]MBP2295007.1 putative integral membrane protein (TIGR02587 family) [Azospirillum rugosum]MDQ0528830.1 putative integral membrane protein (TIGR02587 family) [Azospirillum rugosum]